MRLCALLSLSAPVLQIIPFNELEDVQWALELISHWQWVYLVAGITCLAVLVIAKRAWWPLIPSLVLGASFFVQSATLDRSTEIVGSKPLLQVGMKAEFIRIAASKATNPQMLAALALVESFASHYEEGERTFASRLSANKEKRGESPPKLRKATRDRVDALANDQADLDESLRQQLEELPSAQEVIQAIHLGVSANLLSSKGLLKHYHPDDLPLGVDMLSRQEALVSSLAEFLSAYPGTD